MEGTEILRLGRLCSGCKARAYRGDEKCRKCGVDFSVNPDGGYRKVCLMCGEDFPDSCEDYCPGCARKIGSTLYRCGSCGALHEENQNYCSVCGGQMAWADGGIKGAVCNHSGDATYCPACGRETRD